MKVATILLTALASATTVLADALPAQSPSPASDLSNDVLAATPQPELVDGEPKLELRQAVGVGGAGTPIINPAATQAALQYPSITTQWVESTIGSVATYVSIVYTQTFASVPDQWPTAGAGTIGYGTLSKRDAMPEPTPAPTGLAGRLRI